VIGALRSRKTAFAVPADQGGKNGISTQKKTAGFGVIGWGQSAAIMIEERHKEQGKREIRKLEPGK
jgi:hypothetical protein